MRECGYPCGYLYAFLADRRRRARFADTARAPFRAAVGIAVGWLTVWVGLVEQQRVFQKVPLLELVCLAAAACTYAVAARWTQRLGRGRSLLTS